MKRHQLWLGYSALAALILGPLLLPGYILTFDMSWTPRLPVASLGNASWPFYEILGALGHIIPSMVLQKVVLLSIFIMAGVGMHKLAAERITVSHIPAARAASSKSSSLLPDIPVSTWPALFAGLLFTINPFTYTRFIAGQYLILAGYALLPWFVRALMRLLEVPRKRRAAIVVVWALTIGAISIHAVGFMLALTALITIAWGWGRWRRHAASWKYLALVLGSWLIVSLYWLVPLLRGQSKAAHIIAGIDRDQLWVYATTGGPLHVLSLQGFWVDPHGRNVLASDTGALFWLACIAVMVLAGLGLWRAWRHRDRLGLALAAAGALAFILALGISWAPVRGLTDWLVTNLPYYRGYREPQKWVAVLVIAYAYLGAHGVLVVRERLAASHRRWAKTWGREGATLIAVLLPLALAPMLLWGAGGQLRSANYPASWYELNQRLNELPRGGGAEGSKAETPSDSPAGAGSVADPGKPQDSVRQPESEGGAASSKGAASPDTVLFPWHQYLYLDFAGRTVANPAPAFFDRPLLVSDDPELYGVAPTGPRTPSRRFEDEVLAHRFYATNLGHSMGNLGIRYIVLLRQADWSDYAWLDRQTDLRLVTETDGWNLYEVTQATAGGPK